MARTQYDATTKHLVEQLLAGARHMRESATFQSILEEGRLEGREQGREEGREKGRISAEREILIDLGTLKFGPPDKATAAAIAQVSDASQLSAFIRRVLDATSWQDLLRP